VWHGKTGASVISAKEQYDSTAIIWNKGGDFSPPRPDLLT
jgi:hypothetical protein